MYGMISDRFLKRLFGNRPHRRTGYPTGEAQTLPENVGKCPSAAELAEPDCVPMENPHNDETTPENKKTGDINSIKKR